MTTLLFTLLLAPPFFLLFWYMFLKPTHVTRPSKRDFLDHPNVRQQLKGMQRLFMQQTIMALWQGERPPHSVGGYGTLTKKKLIIEWNDEWQSVMDRLSEYHDISYNILFDIPEEYPEAGIILTAEEILAEYG